jgi:hypothetical protein
MWLRHDTADGDNVRFVGGVTKRVLVRNDERVFGERWVTGNQKALNEWTLAAPPLPFDALAPPPSYVHTQWPEGMCTLP